MLLVMAAHSACDRTTTVVLITLAIGITGAVCASFQVNHIDLSPNHAPVMMGITNGFANLCGIGAPYLAGVILNDNIGSTVSRWRIIFYIAAGIYVIDNIVYVLFASGETQEWDSPNDSAFGEWDSGISSIEASSATTSREGRSRDEEEDKEPLLEP